MKTGRVLYHADIKDHNKLGVYGIFDTTNVRWSYYVISYTVQNSKLFLTPELCGYKQEATYVEIESRGRKFETKELGQSFIQDYKIKWETGSNDTKGEIRSKKIDDILENEN